MNYLKRIGYFLLFAFITQAVFCSNPFITHMYTADPTARVYGDRLYVYPSHDVNVCTSNQGDNNFCMPDYHVFSTTDGTNWTDHGMILTQNNVPWVENNSYGMWAPDCIEKNGKYYFYFPAPPADGSGFRRIGVAISNSPTGPFVPENNYIAGVTGIDPGLFTDDDGQSYLYWGGGNNLFGAKLSADMKSITGPVVTLQGLPSGYKEGSFMNKINGVYYFTFPHDKSGSEELAYATGSSPLGPFTYKGSFMDRWTDGCWTNHHSIVQYKSEWIVFYHHHEISNDQTLRSIHADFLSFGPNNTINKVTPSSQGIAGGFGTSSQEAYPNGTPHPSPGTIEAENFDTGGEGLAYHDTDASNNGPNVMRESEGVDIESRDGGNNVGWTANGEWLEYTVNANSGSYDIEARVATVSTGKSIVVKLDGATLGTINCPNTGNWGTFQTVKIENIPVTGGNNKVLRLDFVGGGVNLNWVKFTAVSQPGNETVSCTSLPNSIDSQTSYTFQVPFEAMQTRDVNIEFWENGAWKKNGTASVNAGSGTANVTVNLSTAPADGASILLKAAIRPTGTNYQQNIDACEKTLTVSGSTPPPTCDAPYSGTNFTVVKETKNWTSGVLDISCAGSVNASMVIAGTGPMENSDYLNVYFKLNGGTQVAISENTNSFASKTVTANNLNGNTLELIVNGKTSWQDETYSVSSIQVVGPSKNASESLRSAKEENSYLNLYPNPADEYLFIEISGTLSRHALIYIFNSSGVLVKSGTMKESQAVDINSLKKGLYFVKMINGDEILTERFVKQ